MGDPRLPLITRQPLTSEIRNRQCAKCRAWLRVAWVDGILVGVDKGAGPTETARRAVTAPNLHVYRQEGEFFKHVSRPALAVAIHSKEPGPFYLEHEHQPLNVITPDGTAQSKPPGRIPGFDQGEPPF